MGKSKGFRLSHQATRRPNEPISHWVSHGSARRVMTKALGPKAALLLTISIIGSTPGQAAMPDPAQTYSDALAKLKPIQRLAAMRRAILDSDEKCRRVTEAHLQGR